MGAVGRRVVVGLRRSWARSVAHGTATVVSVAALARLVMAVGSSVANHGVLIPDEQQYLDLAREVANGGSAEAWAPNYGQSLYSATWAFMAPIRLLFEVVDHRLTAQLWAAAFGVLTALLVLVASRRLIGDESWAVGAGLVVAVLPSQVLWSSVALRESMVWAMLLAVGLGVLLVTDGTHARLGWALTVVAIVVLGMLRQQTMVVAAWSAAVGVTLAVPPARRARVAIAASAAAVLLPLAGGVGLGGSALVASRLPHLGSTRAAAALDAESAIAPTTVLIAPRRSSVATATEGRATHRPVPTTPPTAAVTLVAAATAEVPVTTVQTRQHAVPTTVTERPPSAPPTEQPPTTLTSDNPVVTATSDQPPRTTPTSDQPPETTSTTVMTAPVATAHTSAVPRGVLVARDGTAFLVDDSAAASATNLPRGVLAVLVRPFPWEAGSSMPLRFAALENAAWYLLYVLAVAGVVLATARRRELVYFALVIGGVVATAALSQGNLGTAFRHRAQLLPIVVVLAALGAERIVAQRRHFVATSR